MSFEGWNLEESDPARKKRLAIGYATAISICTVVGVVGASIKAVVPVVADDEPIAVELSPTVEPPKAEPPPPPPPPEEPKPAPGPKGPKKAAIDVPKEVPNELPPEGDPNKPVEAAGDGEGDGEGSGNGSGNAAPLPPPPPPPPPPPKPAGPIQLGEDGTPPSPISKPSPPYPDALKSEGVEGTVVVRFVVTENGDVGSVSVVRGHPKLDPVVIQTVKTWKFKPAMVDGKPVATYQIARFNFKINT